MLAKVFDAVFGCRHSQYSFPMTIRGARRNSAAATTGTYVVCMECGKEMAYDWQNMKVVNGGGSGGHVARLAAKEAA